MQGFDNELDGNPQRGFNPLNPGGGGFGGAGPRVSSSTGAQSSFQGYFFKYLRFIQGGFGPSRGGFGGMPGGGNMFM